MCDFRKEDQDLDRVVGILTPSHPRKNEFSFPHTRKRPSGRIWAFGGIAAMFVVALTIAFNAVTPVSAGDVIRTAFDNISSAESIKVEFAMRGVRTDNDEIYSPDISGQLIEGTVYIITRDGNIYNRIDWNDAEKNSIIFNGKDYIHLKNGEKVRSHSSGFSHELKGLVNMGFIPEDLIKKSKIETSGDVITMESCKEPISFKGVFGKDSRELIKASAVMKLPDGQIITLLETGLIETNAYIPESMFLE